VRTTKNPARRSRLEILANHGRSTVGSDIKNRRHELGFTLEHVARVVGTHKGYISGIENGKVNPPAPKMMMKICTVLKLNIKVMLIKSWVEKAPLAVLDEVISMSSINV
jgi:transcriptional regulator with XRE-family HTH domain